ncbi:MAG TPA: type II secretion system major pseudopilin GspG [Bryobacteraceae bacterium]|nr:type II secretion system major pseudopilin GspG [Bryobacteraceae bacterium]
MTNRRSDLCQEILTERRRNPRAGVTLIEMLVVVTIIALFAAIVGPRLLHRGDQARVVAAKQQIAAFQLALGQYKLDTGTFPTTEQGLAALRQQPQGLDQWHGPYLEKDLANDPWGHPYVYKFPGDHGDEPDVLSYGADGAPGGTDLNADVVSWK